MALDWSDIEIDLIITDYFNMLMLEETGEKYNKTEHRRNLLPLLKNRSEGSIEFKHQNISAVLAHLGQPYIKGYLPRFNYQHILEDKVIDYLIDNPSIENLFRSFAEKDVEKVTAIDFSKLLKNPPQNNTLKETSLSYKQKRPFKANYLEKEQSNRALGIKGEELVITYEKWLLEKQGREKQIKKVRWIAKEDDGAGFDILSVGPNGKDKYIEVKTTKLTKEAPFYFSHNELQFSCNHSNQYHLYRLFNFDKIPGMFIKNGSLDMICHSQPINYKGYF